MARTPSKAVKSTRAKELHPEPESYWNNLSNETSSNQSKLSMVLGALIILVVGILVFNYFNKGKESLGPAQQTQQEQADVTPSSLPGKYTVKEGDTLYLIAQKYYQDGYKFSEIAKTNNISDVNSIEVGQVLDIPKLAEVEAMTSPQPSVTPEASMGTGGGDTTVWGAKIDSDTYTVVEGDWLSTISARAYGDIYAYQKIAAANNISDPNLIYPGQVLKIPR